MIIFVKNTTMEKTENQTAVQWFYKELKNLIRESELTDMTPSKFTNKENQLIEQAKEKELQQKIEYKISTPLGHVSHMIEKYGIDEAIEQYKVIIANNKEDDFWKECLKISKFYNKTFNK
jgi:hypothetical protein